MARTSRRRVPGGDPLPLRHQLLASVIIPALLLALLGAIGVLSLDHLARAAGRVLADNYQSIRQARAMSRTLLQLEARTVEAVDHGATAIRLRVDEAAFERALTHCEANVTEHGEQEVLKSVRDVWSRLERLLDSPMSWGRDQGKEVLQHFQSLHESIHQLVELNEEAMFASERETRRVARVMRGAVLATALATLAALAAFAWASARHESARTRELSHLQQRLALVMNEVLEGLVLLDEERRVVAANGVGATLLGLEGPWEDVPERLEELPLEEPVQASLEPLLGVRFDHERDLEEVTCPLAGEDRIYRPRVLPVPQAEGTPGGHLLLFWDVTEQRRFEQSRRRFLSMLSHQLKTPMTSLQMSVNLLREKLSPASPEQQELLAMASEDCLSLAGLVSDLIDAAREASPDLRLHRRAVDLPRVLRAALRPLTAQAEERGIELSLPAAEPELQVSVDTVKFPWVVTNIAGNALRYTGAGGRIEVGIERREGRVRVWVSDTGSGIAPGDLERIFRPYVSLGEQEDGQAGTHGLGLAIAREIVEAHGGALEAASELGEGTRFVITLPDEREVVS